MSRPRIVVAGLGDTGLLTAIHLHKHADVVGISAKPGLVSGQELGLRLARPQEWARDYWNHFDRYRKLDRVRTVHGSLAGLDLEKRAVQVVGADGTPSTEPYDALVIATGVTNGFWRRPDLQTAAEIDAEIAAAHQRLAEAATVIVIGGGAAAVSSALNAATTWPEKRVDLYFPGDRALPHHHGKVWTILRGRLERAGVGVHPGHRAVVPAGFGDGLAAGEVTWSTGQPASTADAVLWTIGRVTPNTGWLPPSLLDPDGFVAVDEYLRVPGAPGVYAIGDVAATDPLRTSARGRADGLLARNIRADLGDGTAKRFEPATRRWGSVVGAQGNKLEVFTAGGQSFSLPAWSFLQPWVVRRAIYKGMRR
ncbi:pyridine nucleotide-disulfide oxidoreductase [Nocardioides marmoriginsengisoli]|uniref:Pyridine nucleotide-disulfide oxidoreductase n=1 Tax=Nocardioides marmoriginsengisoli TaxID=661483 RepID=A0A3N0CBD5_9ACTN|nr:FAD-dependent oxidoreductase [Nocardioides marmoriginsengisoli]RNL60760.1 pyridine nucleotide-disulfide oxidoreductase [Nocardioides marmoriginsengisoli]